MSFEDMAAIGAPREILLPDLRKKRQTERTRNWTTNNARVLEKSDKKPAVREDKNARLESDFRQAQTKKARYDLNQSLSDIVHAKPASKAKEGMETKKRAETKSRIRNFQDKVGNILHDVANVGEGEKLSPATASKDEIVKNMQMKTGKMGSGDPDKKATIGSFNIEWLGKKKRSEEDYRNIAGVIKDSGAVLLGVQEVSSVEGMNRVMKYLPDHGYVLGRSGQQMVGMIFDKNRVKYDANSIDQMDEVALGNPYMRPPLSVDVKVDNFDFNFNVVHLKAGFQDRSIRMRDEQADAMNKWIKERQKKNPDKDMIIVGDYNDFVGSRTLKGIDKGDTVDYATDEVGKDFYTNIRYKSVIDHAAFSNDQGGASEEYVKGSLRTIDENKYPGYKHSVSDHKPIFFDVRSGMDND